MEAERRPARRRIATCARRRIAACARRRIAPWIAALGLAVGLPGAAWGLSIAVVGPTQGATTDVGVEDPVPGALLTFSVALDASTSIQGYDLILSWDPAELSFVSAADQSGLGFDVSPGGLAPAGERVAAIELAPVLASVLFSVQFQVLTVTRDGAADLAVAANGAGIAPGTQTLDNPGGVVFLIPEPAAALLLVTALLGIAREERRTR